MQILLLTLGMGVLSSVVPLINMEAYIVGVAATVDDPNVWLLALVGGIGQSIGKIPWYEVSRSSLNWGWVKRRMESPAFQARYDKAVAFAHKRPRLTVAMMFVSALIAVPPLAVSAVLAGRLEMRRAYFHAAIVAGRTLQFAALLGGAHVILGD